MRAWGAAWEAVSTPYVLFEGTQVVAHVGVIDLPLVIQGRSVRAGSVHAVATRPDRRRRGLYRRLMEEVLEAAPSQYDLLLLTTENPEYYEPFGFRYVPESRFELDIPIGKQARASAGGSIRASIPNAVPEAGRGQLRPLELGLTEERTLLERLVRQRTPASLVAGIADTRPRDSGFTVFCFNEGFRTIHYSEELDVALAGQVTGTRLDLFDVVGPVLPSLEDLLAAIGSPIERVRFYFTPDRLRPQARPIQHIPDYAGPSYLMVRGEFAAEAVPFALPRTART